MYKVGQYQKFHDVPYKLYCVYLIQFAILSDLDRTNAGRGLISLVVLTTADMLCAPVTPIMDWTPPPDRMEEIGVMNNYFGIGIDAKIALDFHNKREEQPAGRPRSRAKNYIWYGMLGSKELVQK